MKKIMFTSLLLVFVGVLGFSGNVFAEDVLSSADADANDPGLNIGATGATQLDIGLSPKVVARYVTDGTTTVTAQWYAVAAGHPGGNKMYCTGQNLNNIGSDDYLTGTTFTKTLLAIPTTKASEDAFETLGWDFD